MASTRAAAVAEVLWELKRADKVAAFSAIARRAGFSAGSNGRAMLTCLKAVRKDWPHLQWWRAIHDDGTVESGTEQARELETWGAQLDGEASNGRQSVLIDEALMMIWDENGEEVSEPAAKGAES